MKRYNYKMSYSVVNGDFTLGEGDIFAESTREAFLNVVDLLPVSKVVTAFSASIKLDKQP